MSIGPYMAGAAAEVGQLWAQAQFAGPLAQTDWDSAHESLVLPTAVVQAAAAGGASHGDALLAQQGVEACVSAEIRLDKLKKLLLGKVQAKTYAAIETSLAYAKALRPAVAAIANALQVAHLEATAATTLYQAPPSAPPQAPPSAPPQAPPSAPPSQETPPMATPFTDLLVDVAEGAGADAQDAAYLQAAGSLVETAVAAELSKPALFGKTGQKQFNAAVAMIGTAKSIVMAAQAGASVTFVSQVVPTAVMYADGALGLLAQLTAAYQTAGGFKTKQASAVSAQEAAAASVRADALAAMDQGAAQLKKGAKGNDRFQTTPAAPGTYGKDSSAPPPPMPPKPKAAAGIGAAALIALALRFIL